MLIKQICKNNYKLAKNNNVKYVEKKKKKTIIKLYIIIIQMVSKNTFIVIYTRTSTIERKVYE